MAYDLFDQMEGNIFVIPGEYEGEYIDDINKELSKHAWVVVLIMSDENSNFPYKALSHPRMKVWMQYPKDWHEVDHFLPAGYSPKSRFNIPKFKELEWFWGGQVTHQDRFELVEQLRKMDNGFLIESEGFTQGIDLQDYLDLMGTAKYVPIPRGNVSPDTMRLYDALELKCIPVIKEQDRDFYRRVLNAPPFEVINSWSELPNVVGGNDKYTEALAEGIHEWWLDYKLGLVEQMEQDIWLLS